ncbi:hypothetical protein BH09VER1_BH09VER1_11310 [soil metagenome]
MTVFLANPWGLLALLGIPAVLIIHLLRRKSRQVKVSTMFLIERALPSSEGGRRLRSLRNSLPLWVQLLAVCALAWVLAQPRWIDQESTQTVVAVLDSSASMSAFRHEALDGLAAEFKKLDAVSAKTQWIVLSSDGSRLAGGADRIAVLEAAGHAWNPELGTHDTGEAFRLARTLAGEKGVVIFLTDHQPAKEEVAGLSWVSIGRRIDNVGFLGGEVQNGKWSALVKNFGATAHDVRWKFADAPDWRTLHLEAGGISEISGDWPDGRDRLTLELEGDQFALDDTLPLIRPAEKALSVRVEENEGFKTMFDQLLRVAGPNFVTSKEPDVSITAYLPEKPTLPDGSAIVFVQDDGPEQKPLNANIVPENHLLMEDLNWQGLIARDSFGVPTLPTDRVLLWQGTRPLIYLREKGAARQLIFNFDPRHSNAMRLPSFAILNYRFFSMLREAKVAYSAANLETRQRISVAGSGVVYAPGKPDFLTVKGKDGQQLFDGAAQFSDSRESDFTQATEGRSADLTLQTVRKANERGELLDPLWVMILAGLMLWNWILTGAPVSRPQAA